MLDLGLPLLVLAAATAGLVLGIEPIPSWYFQCAWWPYLFAADGLNRRLSGRSLVRDRPRELIWLSAASVAWWTLFEAINLRLGNWYYVMNHPSRAARWIGGALAFATVLPGILVTLGLVESLTGSRPVRVAPFRWSRSKEAGCLALGLGCLLLPLLWPDLFFPLTWGSFVFLIEPWNRRHARESFLRDLERGEAGPFCRTLVAGLVCGVLWESWNFWARTRWIYTVPGFEELKVFEMPLLGFLGFPPFAVQSVVAVRFLETLRGRLAGWPPLRRGAGGVAAYVLGASATALVFWWAEPVTTDSYHVPVAQLRVLPASTRERLAQLGLTTPERLVAALEEPEGLRRWAKRAGVGEAELAANLERVALVLHRGIGEERALQLERLGIRSREDLARWQARELAAALWALEPDRPDPFLERRARAWLGR